MRLVTLLSSLIVLLCGAVAHAAEPLPAPKGPVLLTLTGKIEQMNAPNQAQFDRQMLEALGQESFATGSAFSDVPQRFEGVPLRAVLDRVGAKGSVMKASALNGYEIEIPVSDLQYNPLIAMRVDGQLLKLRDKGPLWIVYPRDSDSALTSQIYDARWIWQLNELHVE